MNVDQEVADYEAAGALAEVIKHGGKATFRAGLPAVATRMNRSIFYPRSRKPPLASGNW